ncbi:hypothetical protein ACFLS1_04790 [Verrucomicrobiota bacterium]
MRQVVQYLMVFAILVLVAGISDAAVRYDDFSRYQVILDKKPFKEPPPSASDKSKLPLPPPAQSFAKNFRMVTLARKEDGRVQVGFVDSKRKPPMSYLLYVGGPAEEGIEVVKADFEAETALLRKENEEAWINTSGIGAALGQLKTGSSTTQRSSSSVSRKISYSELKARQAAMIRSRRETIRHRTVQQPKLKGEELDKQLRKYNMDLIRKGNAPVLPIQLTPEEDAQLVKEGFLPPQE